MRYQFNEIFIENPDGSLSPRQRIRVGPVIISPEIRLQRGVALGGIDFHNEQFINHEIEAELDGEILVIKGIY